MKGFEVMLNGKRYFTGYDRNGTTTVIIGKHGDDFHLEFGGLTEKMVSYRILDTLLNVGDEIKVELTDGEMESNPETEYEFVPGACRCEPDVELTQEQREERNRRRLEYFRRLEALLKSEGLI